MIEIIGEEGTSEYDAALRIADQVGLMWPGLKTSSPARELVKIAANAKVSGYRVSDIDVVVAGVFGGGGRPFIPSRPVRVHDDAPASGRAVHVKNFVVAVEVKDHDSSRVSVVGDKVSVHYTRRGKSEWKSATDQNIDQVHSLVDYFRDLTQQRLYVFRCLAMQGLPALDVAGAVAQGFDGRSFMTAVASVSGVRRGAGGLVLSSGPDDLVRRALHAPLFVRVVPSALDRRRMDAIVSGSPTAEQVYEELGRRMVCLRGRGGTGKTVMLLHAAWKAFRDRGYRTLVLTYNHALAADIRRLMCLLKLPSNPDEGGVKVQTVMSFMSSWFIRLGIADELRTGDDGYEADCRLAVEHVAGGAVTRTDIHKVIAEHQEQYDFDSIVVDEAQDWPQPEADLLKALYGAQKICLADGIDQLVRTQRPTDWRKGVAEGNVVSLPLVECLRMKRNLALFANAVASHAGIRWNVAPNEHAGGGRVIILEKPYTSDSGLHDELVQAAKTKGNDEVDFLHCVPTSDISEVEGRRYSGLGSKLRAAGKEVWDGTDEGVRKDFPRQTSQFRVVHYASCRGLEGWTVVLHGLDEFWRECRDIRLGQGLTEEEALSFQDVSSVANEYAWHRAAIAMTRPIDTLVISLSDKQSALAEVIRAAVRDCGDFVETRAG